MTTITNDKEFELFVGKQIGKNLDNVGKTITERMKMLMEATIGKPTKLTESIKYKVEGNNIMIYSESPIPKFIDEGTKPHIIKPKDPNKPLKFRTMNSGQRKDGSKFGPGDWTATKEVKHPGTEARPFVSQALHLSRQQLEKEIFSSPTFTKTPQS